jgi:SAM-dependent methyltransferase
VDAGHLSRILSGQREPAPQAPSTDRETVAGAAYGDQRHLAARQALFAWARPKHDPAGIVCERLIAHLSSVGILRGGSAPARSALALDVGAGNGLYTRRLRHQVPDLELAALDLSAGILSGIPHPILVADATRLPIADLAVDAVLAMHMLYHLPDPDVGLRELARVLTGRGIAFISTNHSSDKHELDQLWSRAAADVLGLPSGPRRISLSSRFPLDGAPERLGAHFTHVELIDLTGTIEVPTPDPVISHLASYQAWAHQSGVPFDATIERAAQLVWQQIARDQRFVITVRSGILIATGPRIP